MKKKSMVDLDFQKRLNYDFNPCRRVIFLMDVPSSLFTLKAVLPNFV